MNSFSVVETSNRYNCCESCTTFIIIFSICYVSRIAYLFKKNYIRNKFVFIELLLYEIIIHTFIIFLLEKLRYNVSSLHDVFYIYIYFHLSISLGKQSDGVGPVKLKRIETTLC